MSQKKKQREKRRCKEKRGKSITYPNTHRFIGFIVSFLGYVFFYNIVMFIYYQFVKKKYPQVKSYKAFIAIPQQQKDFFSKIIEDIFLFIGIALLFLLLRWIVFL